MNTRSAKAVLLALSILLAPGYPAAQPPSPEPSPPPADQKSSVDGWTVGSRMLAPDLVLLELELRRLHTGGDGDARRVIVRHGEQLVREGGYAGYRILRLEEGVRSGWIWGQRYAEAELQLFRSASWDAF